jgi:prophage regulatory protein
MVNFRLRPTQSSRTQENSDMVRKPMRARAAQAALGVSNSTFYEKIKAGKIPKGTKLDPDGRIVIWWEDEIEAIQKRAVDRQDKAA